MSTKQKYYACPRFSARGNALFLILIAVALFAALSYAITQSGRGSGNIDKEKAKLDAATAQLCDARIDQAKTRLQITGGCTDSQISYEYNGNRVNPDAPVDKHCHVFDPAGAGETACGIYLTAEEVSDDCLTASPGQTCSGGSIVYVGSDVGYRLYTTGADKGIYSWNDAQTTCDSLGDVWHLPNKDELNALYLTKNVGALNGSFASNVYFSSTMGDGGNPWAQYFADGFQTPNIGPGTQYISAGVRCVKS